MNAATLAIDALVALGAAIGVLCAVGFVIFDDPADALHYVGPVTTLAPFAFALAIVVEEGVTSTAGLKALAVAVALFAGSPFVTFATLRAIRTRDTGAPAAPDAPLQE